MTLPPPPPKLLEVKLISAQDIPPVSKLLRTYAVVWIHPDNKLKTHIDHHGHTHPTWNYKLVFPLDDQSSDKNSVLTIQIFNVAWLRDTPIGTATVFISHLKNLKSRRPLSLRLCRPTGLLQGTISIGVNIIPDKPNDHGIPPPPVLRNVDNFRRDNEECVSQRELMDEEVKANNKDDIDIDTVVVRENVSVVSSNSKLQRSRSERTAKDEDFAILPTDDNDIDRPMILNRSNSGWSITQPQPSGSVCSMMQPLPSEVVAALRDGLYSPCGDDYGSSILDNWTENGDKTDREHISEPTTRTASGSRRTASWPEDDHMLPLVNAGSEDRRVQEVISRRKRRDRRHAGGSGSGSGGLLSCFGNAYGFEFSFVCGNNKDVEAEKSKKMNTKNKTVLHVGNPEDKLLRRLNL